MAWGVSVQDEDETDSPGNRGQMSQQFMSQLEDRVSPSTPSAIRDLFDDVMQNCDFLCFPLKQKFIISTNHFIAPNLVNL